MLWILMAAAALILPPVPGAIDPSVTQSNIKTTICVPGYAKRERKTATIVGKLKKEQMSEFHLQGATGDYEEDHLISIELGGAPNDSKNLWPQSYTGQWNAHVKDKLENRLHVLVCDGKVSLSDAQKAISSNWIESYKKYVGE